MPELERPPSAAPAGRTSDAATFAGVFLVALAVLALQIALTRIFSFTIWYHFAYVTISVAMLGYGASGALLAVRPGLAGTRPWERLPLYASGCALSIFVTLGAIAVVPFHPFELRKEPGTQVPLMLVYYLAVTVPFFLAGMCISAALKTLSHRVSRLYFFDLCGAGIGCLLVVPAIWALSTPGAVAASAIVASLAALAFAAGGPPRRALAFALLVPGVAAAGALVVPRLDLRPSPEKFLAFVMKDTYHNIPMGHRWTPMYRTDVFGFRDEEFTRRFSYAGWGISPHWREIVKSRGPKLRLISHDGDACAVIYNFDGDLSKLEMFDHHIVKAPYVVLKQPEVLVIGVGGGMDIVNAVKQGAKHVTGIELDPVTVDLVRNDQADFAGHLYDRPDVTVMAGEGRSTMRHSSAKYDLIQMSGVDTMAALSTGAYVLSESYLYTTESMLELLDHVTDRGLVSFVVADHDERFGYPRHTMRHLALYAAALEARGIDDPRPHVAVVAGAEATPQIAILLKKTPFSPEQSQALQRFADNQGFTVWARPGQEPATMLARFLAMSRAERALHLASLPLMVHATTDDNPFFFNFYRWKNLGKSLGDVDVGHTLATAQLMLAAMLLQSVVLSATLILLPLFLMRRQGLATRGRFRLLAYFAAIGLGFILIEISFVQRFVLFLGYPTYSLTVVLFSLLTYSGIGSALTGRLHGDPARPLVLLVGALAVVTAISLLALPPLFHALLGSPFPVRAVVASASLAPLGLLLGAFFPLGIRKVLSLHEAFVPWAWGVNACASVVGTVLSVVLAMSFGFRAVSLMALGIYALGVFAIRGVDQGLPDRG